MSGERGRRRPRPRRRQGQGRGKGGERRGGGFFRRRRVCKFCAEKIDYINYKDVRLLAPFLPERGKIQPRRISGTCAHAPAQAADRDQARPPAGADSVRHGLAHVPRRVTKVTKTRGHEVIVIFVDFVTSWPLVARHRMTHGSHSQRTRRQPRARGDVVKVAAGLRAQLPAAAQARAGGDRRTTSARSSARGRAAEARELEEKSPAEAVAAADRAGRHRDRAPRRRERHALRLGHVGRHRAGAARQGVRDRQAEDHAGRSDQGARRDTVPVKVHRDVTAQVKVKVVAEQKK